VYLCSTIVSATETIASYVKTVIYLAPVSRDPPHKAYGSAGKSTTAHSNPTTETRAGTRATHDWNASGHHSNPTTETRGHQSNPRLECERAPEQPTTTPRIRTNRTSCKSRPFVNVAKLQSSPAIDKRASSSACQPTCVTNRQTHKHTTK
jgi:hypothetical protein